MASTEHRQARAAAAQAIGLALADQPELLQQLYIDSFGKARALFSFLSQIMLQLYTLPSALTLEHQRNLDSHLFQSLTKEFLALIQRAIDTTQRPFGFIYALVSQPLTLEDFQ